MPFAEANGQGLYYEVHGEGEPLLCVMGLGADHLGFVPQVRALQEHFQVVTFDNRDVGRSSYSDGDYEVIDMAGDTMALADELGLERFHLLGMSLGGTIAQEIALGWPDRAATLTLVVTWASRGPWGEKRARLWANQVDRTPHEEHIDNLMLLCFSERFYEEQPEGVTYLRRLMLEPEHPQKPEGFKRQLAAASRHEARERLQSLRMPVHVIGAEYDVLVLRRRTRSTSSAPTTSTKRWSSSSARSGRPRPPETAADAPEERPRAFAHLRRRAIPRGEPVGLTPPGRAASP